MAGARGRSARGPRICSWGGRRIQVLGVLNGEAEGRLRQLSRALIGGERDDWLLYDNITIVLVKRGRTQFPADDI